MSSADHTSTSRLAGTTAAVAAVIAIVSFLAILAIVIAPSLGGAAPSEPLWQLTFVVAYAGLPVALLLVLGLVVARFLGRRQQR